VVKTEIGGEFGLPVNELTGGKKNQFGNFIPAAGSRYFTSSGRDSLSIILDMLCVNGQDEVLLPSYLCPEILSPLKDKGIKASFYRINPDLALDIDDLGRRITKNKKAVLIIHYFGFPQPLEQLRKLSGGHHLTIIEDLSHSFLSRVGDSTTGGFSGEFSFTSFRKLLPVADGSLLCISKNTAPVSYRGHTLKWRVYIFLRCYAMLVKYIYSKLNFLPKSLFLSPFRLADKILCGYRKPVKISSFSRSLLDKFDFEDIIAKRRSNFEYLLKHWESVLVKPLFGHLPFGVCPLGFPVLTKERDYLRKELIKRGIYPPVHWNLPADVDMDEFADSWDISRHILTIPIDQRYGLVDMEHVLKSIKEIAAGLKSVGR